MIRWGTQLGKEAKTYLSQQDGLDDTKINELSDYFANQIYTSMILSEI